MKLRIVSRLSKANTILYDIEVRYCFTWKLLERHESLSLAKEIVKKLHEHEGKVVYSE